LKPEIGDQEKEAFLKLAGADGEIDAFELQDILNSEFKKGFANIHLFICLLLTPVLNSFGL
jgi:hypothetical protein